MEDKEAGEVGISAIEDARRSAGADATWKNQEVGDGQEDDDDDDPILGSQEARTYRGVAARFDHIAPDRADIAFTVKETARSMSAPRMSDMKKLRRLGKYLIGRPRLIMKFKWQSPQTMITTFTDSDWAGCQKTAKSTSGGALCIGEHVIRTHAKQQKVASLSSAEAELYAMVAASAETIGLQAYARDLGMNLQCELFCDSAAALGISQRAGIGKVRHLRTQGLWVQEVRVSGRIAYKKVLGEKNPADLMTTYMSSELSAKHLETMNMHMSGGRSEAAPTINSLVRGLYVDTIEGNGDEAMVRRKVRFNETVQIRWIPAKGKSRPTPTRGSFEKRTHAYKSGTKELIDAELSAGDDAHDGELNTMHEGQAVNDHEDQAKDGHESQAQKVHGDEAADGHRSQEEVRAPEESAAAPKQERALWADMSDSDHEGSEDEGSIVDVVNNVDGHDIQIDPIEVDALRCESADVELVDRLLSDSACVIKNDFLGLDGCAQVHSGAIERRAARGVQASDWRSGGHLEAGRPVPTACAHGRNVHCSMCRRRSRPSVDDIGRRRSVRCGSRAMHIHACTCTVCFCVVNDSCTCALPCFRTCMNGPDAFLPLHRGSSAINDFFQNLPRRALAHTHLLHVQRGSGAEV